MEIGAGDFKVENYFASYEDLEVSFKDFYLNESNTNLPSPGDLD